MTNPHLSEPRPYKVCGASVQPKQDARWRGIPISVKRVNRLDVHEVQLADRGPNKHKISRTRRTKPAAATSQRRGIEDHDGYYSEDSLYGSC